MFFDKNFKQGPSLSNRILVRLVTLLGLTYIVFFIILFFVLKDFLAVKDRNMAKTKHTQIATLLDDDDTFDINDFLNKKIQKTRFKNLLINVVGPDHKTIYYQRPIDIKHFNKIKVDTEVEKKSNYTGHFKILSQDIGHETIEVFSKKIHGQISLMVGINTDESEDFLWTFINSLFWIMLVLSFAAISIAYLFLRKSLMPIRDLINTIKSIQNGRIQQLSIVSSGNDEIEELNKVFNSMVQHTNKLLDSLQYSLDSIAHDLRTPISHIINRGQMAIKSQDPEAHKEALFYAIEELKELSKLLSTIMDISENEAGSINLNMDSFNLNKLLQECIEIFEYASNEKIISIHIFEFEETTLTADRNRLKQVFINLISNSIKYSDSPLNINISVVNEASEIKIIFQDNGWGISTDDRQKIWERLYRADKSRSTQGMGLGLTLAKSIILLHKGNISLESEPGQGSTFTIILPKN